MAAVHVVGLRDDIVGLEITYGHRGQRAGLLARIQYSLARFGALHKYIQTNQHNHGGYDHHPPDFQDPDAYNKMAAIYQNWVINPNTNGPIRVSRRGGSDPIYPVSIKGLTTRKFLRYEKKKYGINIG